MPSALMVLFQKVFEFAGSVPRHYTRTTKKTSHLKDSADVAVSIYNQRQTFTNGDEISGEVVLNLSDEIDISEIVIKYKVEVNTLVCSNKQVLSLQQKLDLVDARPHEYIDRKPLGEQQRNILGAEQKQQRQSTDHSRRDGNRFYSQEVRVYPSPSTARVRRLTLPSGTHCFPFTLRLPGYAEKGFKVLPPSFTDQKGNFIKHTIKATVRRPGNSKYSLRAKTPVEFMPVERPLNARATQRVNRNFAFGNPTSLVSVIAEVPGVMKPGVSFPIGLIIISGNNRAIDVDGVVIELIQHLEFKAGTRRDSTGTKVAVFTRDISANGTLIDLGHYLEDTTITHALTPSFHNKHISLSYRLRVGVRVSAFGKETSTLALEHDLPVMGCNTINTLMGIRYTDFPTEAESLPNVFDEDELLHCSKFSSEGTHLLGVAWDH